MGGGKKEFRVSFKTKNSASVHAGFLFHVLSPNKFAFHCSCLLRNIEEVEVFLEALQENSREALKFTR